MPNRTNEGTSRRHFLLGSALTTAAMAGRMSAQGTRDLHVASAGSIRSLLDGHLKMAAAKVLSLDLNTRSGGAYAVARDLVAATLRADVFISVTAGPMLTVMSAGKAQAAYPIAKTEMVIHYNPRSCFAAELAAAAVGTRNWWEVLQTPGLRFMRSNPLDDPSGRSIIFTMMLAANEYGVPDLVQRVLGAPLNPAQILAGTDIRAGLEAGASTQSVAIRSPIFPARFPRSRCRKS